jgi:hypothetical protein
MQNMMLALRGPGNSGKTEAIVLVVERLAKYLIEPVKRGYPRRDDSYGRPRPPEVRRAILRINDVLVGIASPGDDDKQVKRFVKPLIADGCQVIVCATRTDPSKAMSALKELSKTAPGYEIEYIDKKQSSRNAATAENQKMADYIVKRLFEITGMPIVAA